MSEAVDDTSSLKKSNAVAPCRGDEANSDDLDDALEFLLSDFDGDEDSVQELNTKDDKESDGSSNDTYDVGGYASLAECQRMEETCAEAQKVLDEYRKTLVASVGTKVVDLGMGSTTASNERASSNIGSSTSDALVSYAVDVSSDGASQQGESLQQEEYDYYTETLSRLRGKDPTLETLELYNPMEWDMEMFRDDYGDMNLCGLFAAMTTLLKAAKQNPHLKRLEFCYVSRLDNPIMRGALIDLMKSSSSPNISNSCDSGQEVGPRSPAPPPRRWDRILIDECGGISYEFMNDILKQSNITSLHLTHNMLSSRCISVLGRVLQTPPLSASLNELRLTEVMTPSSMSFLANGLEGNTTLATLDITGSIFANKTVTTTNLATGLKRNSGLRTLNISRCDLEDENVAELVRSLVQHTNLVWLDLSNNLCGIESCKALAALLRNDNCGKSQLSGLTLTSCGVDDIGATELIESLRANTSLMTLHLSENKISDCGISDFANILQELKTLKTLWLTENEFGDQGAEQLLTAMKKNAEMEQLAIDRHLQYFDEIQFYTTLNKAGRRLLGTKPNSVPLSLWSLVLDRCQRVISNNHHMFRERRIGKADVLFYLLHGPLLFQRREVTPKLAADEKGITEGGVSTVVD